MSPVWHSWKLSFPFLGSRRKWAIASSPWAATYSDLPSGLIAPPATSLSPESAPRPVAPAMAAQAPVPGVGPTSVAPVMQFLKVRSPGAAKTAPGSASAIAIPTASAYVPLRIGRTLPWPWAVRKSAVGARV